MGNGGANACKQPSGVERLSVCAYEAGNVDGCPSLLVSAPNSVGCEECVIHDHASHFRRDCFGGDLNIRDHRIDNKSEEERMQVSAAGIHEEAGWDANSGNERVGVGAIVGCEKRVGTVVARKGQYYKVSSRELDSIQHSPTTPLENMILGTRTFTTISKSKVRNSVLEHT